MNRSVRVAQWSVAVIVTAASVSSFAESYRALFDWASSHQVGTGWSVAWPLMIDTFILMGELALFIAMAKDWSWKAQWWPWTVTTTGLAVSVAGNVGHVQTTLVSDRVTAAVPPLAAFASLTVGMIILKQYILRLSGPEPVTGDYVPRHSDRLSAMQSDSLRIKYAIEITGSRNARELVAWLNDEGYEVSPENARTVLRRALTSVDTMEPITA